MVTGTLDCSTVEPRFARLGHRDLPRVQEGLPLFVAFAGEKVNGNSYLLSAAQAGCCGVSI